MKFNVKINKFACFYFFIQNLSEWHFSNNKNYNAIWKRELGSFSEIEENSLIEFKKIRSQYGWQKPGFESIFYTNHNPLKEIADVVPLDKQQLLNKIFTVFQNKFDILYQKEINNLQNWQKELSEKINNQELNQEITSALSILYNIPAPTKEIDVYLLFSGPNTTGGGANIDDKSITLEISRYPIQGVNHAIGIIWHETTHLLFEKVKFSNLIKQLYPDLEESKLNLREITIGLLFPRGVLGQRFLGASMPATSYFGKLGHKSKELIELINEYVYQKKPLDQIYLNKVITIANQIN